MGYSSVIIGLICAPRDINSSSGGIVFSKVVRDYNGQDVPPVGTDANIIL